MTSMVGERAVNLETEFSQRVRSESSGPLSEGSTYINEGRPYKRPRVTDIASGSYMTNKDFAPKDEAAREEASGPSVVRVLYIV